MMNLPFQVNLERKVVVVTGGSGVLGAVMARALASCGASGDPCTKSGKN